MPRRTDEEWGSWLQDTRAMRYTKPQQRDPARRTGAGTHQVQRLAISKRLNDRVQQGVQHGDDCTLRSEIAPDRARCDQLEEQLRLVQADNDALVVQLETMHAAMDHRRRQPTPQPRAPKAATKAALRTCGWILEAKCSGIIAKSDFKELADSLSGSALSLAFGKALGDWGSRGCMSVDEGSSGCVSGEVFMEQLGRLLEQDGLREEASEEELKRIVQVVCGWTSRGSNETCLPSMSVAAAMEAQEEMIRQLSLREQQLNAQCAQLSEQCTQLSRQRDLGSRVQQKSQQQVSVLRRQLDEAAVAAEQQQQSADAAAAVAAREQQLLVDAAAAAAVEQQLLVDRFELAAANYWQQQGALAIGQVTLKQEHVFPATTSNRSIGNPVEPAQLSVIRGSPIGVLRAATCGGLMPQPIAAVRASGMAPCPHSWVGSLQNESAGEGAGLEQLWGIVTHELQLSAAAESTAMPSGSHSMLAAADESAIPGGEALQLVASLSAVEQARLFGILDKLNPCASALPMGQSQSLVAQPSALSQPMQEMPDRLQDHHSGVSFNHV